MNIDRPVHHATGGIGVALLGLLLLDGCAPSGSVVTVKYDSKPWQEVAITASKIDPSRKNEINRVIEHAWFRHETADVYPYIAYTEFCLKLSDASIGPICRFNGSNGVVQCRIPKGTWVVLLVSDTSGKSSAKIIDVASSDCSVDFRTHEVTR